MRKQVAQERLPLKELELLVLLSTEEEELHGYALLTRITERSDGFLSPGPASLYRTLAHLTRERILEAFAGNDADDPRRRYYRPTPFGRAVLRAELRRMSRLLHEAHEIGIRFEPNTI